MIHMEIFKIIQDKVWRLMNQNNQHLSSAVIFDIFFKDVCCVIFNNLCYFLNYFTFKCYAVQV